MKLLEIQTELNAPKSQFNKFAGYNYRSCEDILSAVKPLLKKHSCTLWLDDEMVQVGNRIYVKATATFIDGDLKTISHGWAREEEVKKGMDSSQITGAASSYARKYALNALFLIDDNKDSDATNDHNKAEPTPHSEPAKPHVEAKHNPEEPKTIIEKLSEVRATKSDKFFTLIFANGLKLGCGVHTALEAKKALEADHKVSVEYGPNDKGYMTCISLVEVIKEEEVPF